MTIAGIFVHALPFFADAENPRETRSLSDLLSFDKLRTADLAATTERRKHKEVEKKRMTVLPVLLSVFFCG
jgi:hypothetical protein